MEVSSFLQKGEMNTPRIKQKHKILKGKTPTYIYIYVWIYDIDFSFTLISSTVCSIPLKDTLKTLSYSNLQPPLKGD